MAQQRRDNPEHVRALDRARYRRDKPKRRKAMDAYASTHVGEVNKTKRAWIDRNPDKRKANIAVGNALRDGKLVRGPCERAAEGGCSTPGKRSHIQAHHDAYSKPLEVRWLCTAHHAEERTKEENDGTD